jgi:hypothetical protein
MFSLNVCCISFLSPVCCIRNFIVRVGYYGVPFKTVVMHFTNMAPIISPPHKRYGRAVVIGHVLLFRESKGQSRPAFLINDTLGMWFVSTSPVSYLYSLSSLALLTSNCLACCNARPDVSCRRRPLLPPPSRALWNKSCMWLALIRAYTVCKASALPRAQAIKVSDQDSPSISLINRFLSGPTQ